MAEAVTMEQAALFQRVYEELGIPEQVDVERFATLNDLVDQAFTSYAQRPAFSSLGRTLSYAELDRLSGHFASWLQNYTQLQPGDRIAVQMPNLVQYPVVVLGALRAGMVIVNTNPLYSAREIEHQFNDAGVKALVVQANVAQTVAEVLPRTGVKHVLVTELADLHSPLKRLLINNVAKYVKKIVPPFSIPGAGTLNAALRLGEGKPYVPVVAERNSLAMLQYTGGTTGVAKGAMLSHGNLVSNILQVDALFASHGLGEDDTVVVQPLPVYHIYAFMTSVYAMLNGQHMVYIPNPRDIDSIVKVMRDYRPAMFCGLNTLFVALCQNEAFKALDFSGLLPAVKYQRGTVSPKHRR
jgi:long-chain acyl-CoA synthetase